MVRDASGNGKFLRNLHIYLFRNFDVKKKSKIVWEKLKLFVQASFYVTRNISCFVGILFFVEFTYDIFLLYNL